MTDAPIQFAKVVHEGRSLLAVRGSDVCWNKGPSTSRKAFDLAHLVGRGFSVSIADNELVSEEDIDG